jgi:plasmid stability protein
MAQLIVRKLEDKVVRKLKERAAQYGVSMEEEHRRILRETLLKKEKPKMSFKEFLIAPPYVDVDLMKYIPKRDKRHRKVDLR